MRKELDFIIFFRAERSLQGWGSACGARALLEFPPGRLWVFVFFCLSLAFDICTFTV